MQGHFCAQVCTQHLRNRFLISTTFNAGRFAARSSSGFKGFNAGEPSRAPDNRKDKAPGFNATGARPRKAPRYKSAKELNAEVPLRSRFRFRKSMILYPIVAFIGYKFYTWETKLERSIMLTPRFFLPFILESRERVSSTSAILNLLSLPRGQNTEIVSDAWKRGVWSVDVMQPELQIMRSYTPLPPIEGTEPEQVRLFVRYEPQGEVSTFLHKIYRGTFVNIRGPRIEYEIPENVDEILFLAGGTGIAPALQVAHTLFNHRLKSTEGGPELRILWANRKREDSIDGIDPVSYQRAQAELVQSTPKLADEPQGELLSQPQETTGEVGAPSKPLQNRLVEEVEKLKARHGGKIIVDYFIDEEGSYITERLLKTYLSDLDQTSNQDGTPRTKVILVSGPDGFVDAFAGPKIWQRGRELQGPVGGILKKIDPQGWKIWKL